MKSHSQAVYWSLKLVLAFSVLISGASEAQSVASWDDSPPLDPPYTHLTPLMPEFPERSLFNRRNPTVSDALAVISAQTSVKSQGRRGSCSHFSAVAMLEAALVSRSDFPTSVDLSEEWMAYLQARTTASDGSTSVWNFSNARNHGVPSEERFPYIDRNWESLESDPLAAKRCGSTRGFEQKACLLAHWDPRLLTLADQVLNDKSGSFFFPEFVEARAEAQKLRDEQFKNLLSRKSLWTESEVKSYLADGIPVLLDVDFFYGAWNHRVGEELGMRRKDGEWAQGVVTYPEPGSVDRARSKEKPAGHSILLVGYDDTKEIETDIQMSDGTTRRFVYKGVYYFKNSWGTSSFGSQFEIKGVSHPGYGLITQRYAHEEGGFFSYFD